MLMSVVRSLRRTHISMGFFLFISTKIFKGTPL